MNFKAVITAFFAVAEIGNISLMGTISSSGQSRPKKMCLSCRCCQERKIKCVHPDGDWTALCVGCSSHDPPFECNHVLSIQGKRNDIMLLTLSPAKKKMVRQAADVPSCIFGVVGGVEKSVQPKKSKMEKSKTKKNAIARGYVTRLAGWCLAVRPQGLCWGGEVCATEEEYNREECNGKNQGARGYATRLVG